MSDVFSQILKVQLDKFGLSRDDWHALLQRLLDYGVLCRDDSLVEADFYDLYLRLEPLIIDYLSLIGINVEHERHFRFVRVLPPGAKSPGNDQEYNEGINTSLRLKLSQHEVALVLILRAEYDKALRDGAIDESGCVNISVEALALSLKSLLKRNLSDLVHERRQYFRRLRQMRLIHYVNESDLDTGDGWLKIRPTIINIVSNEWLTKVAAGLMSNDLNPADDGSVSSQDTKTAQDSLKKSNSLFEDV
jgi:hypothetical protein